MPFISTVLMMPTDQRYAMGTFFFGTCTLAYGGANFRVASELFSPSCSLGHNIDNLKNRRMQKVGFFQREPESNNDFECTRPLVLLYCTVQFNQDQHGADNVAQTASADRQMVECATGTRQPTRPSGNPPHATQIMMASWNGTTHGSSALTVDLRIPVLSRRLTWTFSSYVLEYVQVGTDRLRRVWSMTTVSGGNVTICANNAAHLSAQVDAHAAPFSVRRQASPPPLVWWLNTPAINSTTSYNIMHMPQGRGGKTVILEGGVKDQDQNIVTIAHHPYAVHIARRALYGR
ncbi:hypothetical protein F5888DRAFT_1635633 [Russula emetica]|nr:hypothetical protein F5888DRAFT_1635633 [Russula emetica]